MIGQKEGDRDKCDMVERLWSEGKRVAGIRIDGW